MSDNEKHPIARQLELVSHVRDDKRRVQTTFTGIVYTHWRDGRITRRETANGEDVRVGYMACGKVDHDKYEQHTEFMTFIAKHAYNLSYVRAIAEGLLPKRPETISERAARRKAWYEADRDRRLKLQKANGFE
jgi:hypothetical protein